ncbi:MAG: DUF1538 domain-containing protein [Desulfovibrio sp.]|jgi:hypothetical protein|nr:DUF1538 domain-containing protein [Desulfovibrio sp.]
MLFVEKLKETGTSVMPVMALVFFLHCTVAPVGSAMGQFLAGGVLVILGLTIFLVGAEVGVLPMGQRTGAELVKRRNLPLILAAGFVIGFFITVAEPDVQVLATQVAGVNSSIPPRLLVAMIAAGVGLFVSIALGRIILQVSYRFLLVIFYALVFVCAFFTHPSFLGIGFDAGGATTGPMTVPFIMALGVGVAVSGAGHRSAADDSFGLIGLASIGPILAVLILGLLLDGTPPADGADLEEAAAVSLDAHFLRLVPEVLVEVGTALGPLAVLFAVFQITLCRMPGKQVSRLIMGLIYTFLGLALFFVGVKGGFMPAGGKMGAIIGGMDNNGILIPIGLVLGAMIVCAEPAVWVLTSEVENVSGGHIRRFYMLLSLSIGVSCAVGIAMLRVLTGLSIWWFLVPGYILAIGLSRFCPPMFTALAFDSGGVASGPMASTFILAFTVGASGAAGSNPITDAFGVIAMIAMTPLIAIQVLGILFQRQKNRSAHSDAGQGTRL